MGKAAENERIKLRAAFYNNVSVGLVVTGFFVPLLTVYQKMPEILPFIHDWQDGRLQHADVAEKIHYAVYAVGAFVLAMSSAVLCRLTAKREIRKIQD
jgi:hypothetical protein